MKNIAYLLVLFFCIAGTSLSAQIIKLPNQISSASGKGGEPERIYLNDNCEFIQRVNITISNLDEIVGDPCGLNIAFPTHLYPEMHLRCTAMGIERTVPMTYFHRKECEVAGGTPSLYEFNYNLTVNLADYCEEFGPHSPINMGTVTAQIGTYEGEIFVDYQMCNYTGAGDIFDCAAFGATDAVCSPENCDSHTLANKSVNPEDRFCFGGCFPDYQGDPGDPVKFPGGSGEDTGGGDGDGGDDGGDEGDTSNFRLASKDFSLSVSPNPFSSQLNINWQNTTDDGMMRIMDTSGRVLQTWSASAAGTLNWDTSDLPKGMYILEVKDGTNTKFMKLVKS